MVLVQKRLENLIALYRHTPLKTNKQKGAQNEKLY